MSDVQVWIFNHSSDLTW